jgi:HD-GYP domain-containing protein (c-di-GMP phosphodiesterase class II)
VAHTWRVVLYTRALAEEAGLGAPLIARLTTAAALHDVGKLDIADEILQKPGRLTPGEFAIIQGHTVRGHDRLIAAGETDPVILHLVRHHHERWDGRGYPDALAGESIPSESRYFAVIDSFDAMTSVRPYRNDVGEDAARNAIEELERGAGTQYWPRAVELFVSMHRTGRLDWIGHHFNDSCPIDYDHNHGTVTGDHDLKGRPSSG